MTRRHDARIAETRRIAGGLVLVRLDVDAEVRATHVRPAQYVDVAIADGANGSAHGYFVLASEVGAPAWELLVRPAAGAADALAAASPGAPARTSTALGRGFPFEDARGRRCLVAVAGSGIGAARPAIAWRVNEGDGGRTELLLGVRDLADVPFEEELAAWARAGVRVTACLSRPSRAAPAAAEGVAIATGYVQEVARAHLVPGGHDLVFAVGQTAMVAAMRDVARDLGIAEADVRTNE